MARSFRRLPPEPRPGLLVRSGLRGRLAGRWDHPVTAVVGGPGRGKTTLLAQALAADRDEPGSDDVWLGLEPADADGDRLARAAADALADHERRPETLLAAGDVTPRPASVADAVWQRAPRRVCLVLDDAHLLPPGSTGQRWLADLVAALPANGHVLLATATDPPPGFHATVLVAGDELVLDTAAVDDEMVDRVVEGLGTELRPVVAVLADLGGGDADVLEAALGPGGSAVDPTGLRGVPLVAWDADGWFVAHELLAAALGPPGDRDATRSRAVEHLVGRGRFDDAFLLASEAERWDLVPGVLRAASLVAEALPANQLGRWLAACPAAVVDSPAGRLATGLQLAYTAPFEAIHPLRRAADELRAAGDAHAELVAIGHIGRLAWWWQDATLLQEQTRRVFALEQEGHPRAGALAAFAWALVADMGGDDEAVLAHLGRIRPEDLDPGWALLARWYEGLVRLYLGQPAATRIIVDSLTTADPSMGYVVETLELMALWATGHVDAVMERTPAVVAAARAYGVTYSLAQGLTTASLAHSHTGDPAAARRYLDEAHAAAPPPAAGNVGSGAPAGAGTAAVFDAGSPGGVEAGAVVGTEAPAGVDSGAVVDADGSGGLGSGAAVDAGVGSAAAVVDAGAWGGVGSDAFVDAEGSGGMDTVPAVEAGDSGGVEPGGVVDVGASGGVGSGAAVDAEGGGVYTGAVHVTGADRPSGGDEGAESVVAPGGGVRLPVQAALAVASLLLAEGDEDGAAATLEQAAVTHGVDRGTERRWWRQALALSYVLVPEARAVWDGRELRGHLSTARSLAAAVVALRDAGEPTALRGVALPHLGVARSALHHRFAAELAVGLAGRDQPEGRHLLEALGAPGRAVVRTIATDPREGWGPAMVQAARSLLAAVPSPPPEATHLAVLGPLSLRRGAAGQEPDEVDAGALTDPAARALLAFLVAHRRTTRVACMAAVWPDRDQRPSGTVLGDVLDRVLDALEPTRSRGEPAYLLRRDGDAVELVTGDHLRLDVDAFDAHVAAAARAESDGAPAEALAHHRAVAALYRGPLHADLREAEGSRWARERELYRARFAASAVRAAELLAARGGPGDAEEASALVARVEAGDA